LTVVLCGDPAGEEQGERRRRGSTGPVGSGSGEQSEWPSSDSWRRASWLVEFTLWGLLFQKGGGGVKLTLWARPRGVHMVIPACGS